MKRFENCGAVRTFFLCCAGSLLLCISAVNAAQVTQKAREDVRRVSEFLDSRKIVDQVDESIGQAAFSIVLFSLFDKDSNGVVSKAEFLEGVKDRPVAKSPISDEFRERLLEELAANIGGRIQTDELREAFIKAERQAAGVKDFEAEFRALGGDKAEALSFAQFDAARRTPSPAPGLLRVITEWHTEFSLRFLGQGPAGVYPARRDLFEVAVGKWRLAQAEAAEAETPRPIPGFFPDYGLVLAGDPTRFDKDPFTDAVVLRVAASGQSLLGSSVVPRLTGSEALESAEIGFSKSGGSESQISVDGALRLDWRREAWLQNAQWKFLPFAAVDVQRRGSGDEMVDLRRYYVQAFYFTRHGNTSSLLEASGLTFGPMYETNLENDVNTLAISADWEPIVNLGPVHFGRWQNFPGLAGTRYALAAKLGLQYRDITRQPTTSDIDDSFYSTAKLQAKLALFDGGLQVGYSYSKWLSFNSGNPDAGYHEWRVSIPLSRDDTAFLTGSYKDGEASPGASSTRTYQVGLGLQY